MFIHAKNTLVQLQHVLKNILNTNYYTTPLVQMSNATIGQHTRHIIEMYNCLLNGYNTGVVNYDNRARSYALETDVALAITEIENIINSIVKNDKTIYVETAFNNNQYVINATYFREVLYNIEHCIHHQALIKVALALHGITVTNAAFGVAPSTLKYQLQCAH